MFSHTKTKEAKRGIVEIKKASAEAVRALVRFCYGGRIEQLDETLVVEVFVLADRYQMPSLMVCAARKKSKLPLTSSLAADNALRRLSNLAYFFNIQRPDLFVCFHRITLVERQ